MMIQIGRPAHGFSEPFGLLSDCHRRIERFLRALVIIAGRASSEPIGARDRLDLEASLHYFATSGRMHTADEEESVFPRLRACADLLDESTRALVDRLEADHRDADALHEQIDALGRGWLASGVIAPEDAVLLREHLSALEWIYGAHIQTEDETLLPAASRTLSTAEIAKVGEEMAGRRGVPFRAAGAP